MHLDKEKSKILIFKVIIDWMNLRLENY